MVVVFDTHGAKLTHQGGEAIEVTPTGHLVIKGKVQSGGARHPIALYHPNEWRTACVDDLPTRAAADARQ